jgi:hypothetical protein
MKHVQHRSSLTFPDAMCEERLREQSGAGLGPIDQSCVSQKKVGETYIDRWQ